MVLELIFNKRCLHHFSKSFSPLPQEGSADTGASLLILSSDRAVTDCIYFDISKASLSRIPHCARCHSDNNDIISNSNTFIEQEPTDLLSIDSGPYCRLR